MGKYTIKHFKPGQIQLSRLLPLLKKLDPFFIPTISSRISLDAYAEKISNYADIFVAIDLGEDVGICAIYTNAFPDAFITAIGVLPQVARKGIGGQLRDASVGLAKSKGLKKVCLEVSSNNSAALEFYKKACFLFVEEHHNMLYMEQTI